MSTDSGPPDQEASPSALKSADRQAAFDRRYRLLELRERTADRELERRKIEIEKGRGLSFTASQATVAAAAIALLSALAGGLIQGAVTRDVATGKNQSALEIEKLKANANIALDKQKQDAAERLDREKFETTLILKATEAPTRDAQIRNLKFFLDAGFIRDPDGKIANIDEVDYPSTPPPVAQSFQSPAFSNTTVLDAAMDLSSSVTCLNSAGVKYVARYYSTSASKRLTAGEAKIFERKRRGYHRDL